MRPLGRHSYGRYEVVRVFVPALYLALLLLLFFWAYLNKAFATELTTGQTIALYSFVTLVAAMSLYGKEVPKRRKAFATNQPSFYLSTRTRGGTGAAEHATEPDAVTGGGLKAGHSRLVTGQ